MGRCIEIDNFQFVVFVRSRVRGGNAPPSMTKSEPFFKKVRIFFISYRLLFSVFILREGNVSPAPPAFVPSVRKAMSSAVEHGL